MAQKLKRLPGMQETQVRSLGWEDPLEKEMTTHSNILAWKIPRTEEPGGLYSSGSKESDASFMGGAMLSKSLIQFSVDGQGCVPSLLFDLRPNYGGGNEDNGGLLQKIPCMHCGT